MDTEKHFVVDKKYDRIVLDIVHHGEPTLGEIEWKALEKAEERIYGSESHAAAYTSVVHIEESSDAARLWSLAQNPVDDELEREFGDLQDVTPDNLRNNRIARRVADALAVVSFGSEILLK